MDRDAGFSRARPPRSQRVRLVSRLTLCMTRPLKELVAAGSMTRAEMCEILEERGLYAGPAEVEDDVGDEGDLDAEMEAALRLNAQLREMEIASAKSRKKSAPAPQPAPVATRKPPAARSVQDKRPRRAAPQGRVDATHSNGRIQEIQRKNMALLTNLERIQKKGGVLDTKPKVRKHVAASSVNRKRQLQKTADQDMVRSVSGTTEEWAAANDRITHCFLQGISPAA